MAVRSLRPLSSLHAKTVLSPSDPACPILVEQAPVGWGYRRSRMAQALLLPQSLHGLWGVWPALVFSTA